MRALSFMTAFSLGISSLSAAALAQDAPSNFGILGIKTQGDGCRQGTVGQNISADRRAFTLVFSEFVAELNASTSKKDERKSCKAIFDTEQDRGWEYAVVGVVFRGASFLSPGVAGSLDVRYGTRGKDARSQMNLNGPFDDSYVHTNTVDGSQLKWNGCQGNGNGNKNRVKDFTVDSQIYLKSRDAGAQGYFTVDSVDGEVTQTYQLAWRRCGR